MDNMHHFLRLTVLGQKCAYYSRDFTVYAIVYWHINTDVRVRIRDIRKNRERMQHRLLTTETTVLSLEALG